MKIIKEDIYAEHVVYKSPWAGELEELSKDTRSTLFKIKIPILIVADRIRENSFLHGESSGAYCCDELLADLYVVRLGTLLPLLWFELKMKRTSKSVIRDIFINNTDLSLMSSK